VAEVRPVADGHEISIDDEGGVTVEANPDEIHRVALNLLENGVRHTPPGTEITVRDSRDDGAALLQVSDDGPGIPLEMREAVFSRFVRGAGPSDRAAGDGAGLGLAIVAAVAASHGGEATVGESTEGGARFTVRLPAVALKPEDAPVATPG
jgi:two-component system OmpR family sensor kinase